MKLSPRALLRTLRERKFSYTHLIELSIYKKEILHNYSIFTQALKPLSVAPVLKSNAYGHGLVEVARILDTQNPPFFCVDSFFEALILRNEGIISPILIIGYTPLTNMLKHTLPRVSFSIGGLEELRRASAAIHTPTAIHIKIDTGMHRQGIMPEEIDEAITLVYSNSSLTLEGVYSHLADADTPNSSHTAAQLFEWNRVAKKMHDAFPAVRYLHCAATAGSVLAKDIYSTTVRLGIGLYGISVGSTPHDLHPALEMRSRITSLRTIREGESIGYNATFTASARMRIATTPVGYAEGIDRRLSNSGALLMHDTPCPIVGTVSMNITSIDVSSVPEASLDDEVIIISKDSTAVNSIAHIAERCGTIPYEIMVHLPERLHRTVV